MTAPRPRRRLEVRPAIESTPRCHAFACRPVYEIALLEVKPAGEGREVWTVVELLGACADHWTSAVTPLIDLGALS